MYLIHIETKIKTTQQRCFDLSRSIDFHAASLQHTNEIPVSGRTSGLIEAGEFVEWEATHLYVRQRLTSKITAMEKHRYFVDEMVNGAFKSFHHKHEIKVIDNENVLMIDDFNYEVPLGMLGHVAYKIFLRKYMEDLIRSRCNHTKTALESDEWKQFLDN